MKSVQPALTLGSMMAAVAVACLPSTAAAAEARFEIRAYVPERCGASAVVIDPLSGSATGASCNFAATLKIQTSDVMVEAVDVRPVGSPAILMAASTAPSTLFGAQDCFFGPDTAFGAMTDSATPTRVRVVTVSL